MWDKLKNDEVIRALITLVLGLFFLNFLFATLFGTGNIMYQYMGLANLVINLFVLLLIGTFFYGFYVLLKEHAQPLVSEFKPLAEEVKSVSKNLFKVGEGGTACPVCGKIVYTNWQCCPYCGGEVGEPNKV